MFDPTAIDLVEGEILNDYQLDQNYPNPFNPQTTIRFSLPKATEVKVDIYAISGQHVVTLLNTEKAAGSYILTFDAKQLSSGLYFYTIRTKDFYQVKKMMLMK